MERTSRRRVLLATAGLAAGAGCTWWSDAEEPSPADGAGPTDTPSDGETGTATDGEPETADGTDEETAVEGDPRASTLAPVGHSLLGAPDVEFAHGAVRADGRYAVVGSWRGSDRGSFLVALSDPSAPERVHHLPNPDGVKSMDVKFDARDGLYYRTQEPVGGQDPPFAGVEVVDYGFDEGTPDEPAVVGRLDAGPTHNLRPHPEAPVVYTANYRQGDGNLQVWAVDDPTSPERLRTTGEGWPLHDVTIDADAGHLHCAYNNGYVLMDASDPGRPTELGRFDYRDQPSYEEAGPGERGFKSGHLAKCDPRRDLVYVGDEVGIGVPGGKHVFDVGWDEGSPSAPEPIGFTKSPNAEVQQPEDGQERAEVVRDWTGHNFDVLARGEATLLVSGDWAEGVVLYDVTDPTEPTPIDRRPTDEGAGRASGPDRFGGPPYCWSAAYDDARDLVVASDVFTGVHTFRLESGGG
jgi:hypothetical protein